MEDKCKIPHLKNRFLRKPVESFEHKWGNEFYKRVYKNTGEYIEGKPVQYVKPTVLKFLIIGLAGLLLHLGWM